MDLAKCPACDSGDIRTEDYPHLIYMGNGLEESRLYFTFCEACRKSQIGEHSIYWYDSRLICWDVNGLLSVHEKYGFIPYTTSFTRFDSRAAWNKRYLR